MRAVLGGLIGIALALVVTGCANGRRASSAEASPNAAPSPLAACETRELTLGGADLVIAGNADGTLASVTVVRVANATDRKKALHAVRVAFGPALRDTAVIAHASKWGLTTWTDRCGRAVAQPAPLRVPASPRGSPAHG